LHTSSDVQVAALFAAGFRGIEKKLAIPVPPIAASASADMKGQRLPKTLSAATEAFMKKSSIARELFGDDFVDHFGGTRKHELREFEEAITDWEMMRYMELA
jgi:glutamine synthetase